MHTTSVLAVASYSCTCSSELRRQAAARMHFSLLPVSRNAYRDRIEILPSPQNLLVFFFFFLTCQGITTSKSLEAAVLPAAGDGAAEHHKAKPCPLDFKLKQNKQTKKLSLYQEKWNCPTDLGKVYLVKNYETISFVKEWWLFHFA